MNLRSLPEYKNLEEELERCVNLNVNFLIVTFVGYSVSFFIKKILEKKKSGITYINRDGQKLSKYNILDLDFCSNPNALEIVEKYIKSANLDQKFAVVINTPYVLEMEDFKRSYIGTHFYSVYKFKKPSFEVTKTYANLMKVKLSESALKTVYQLTGGIGRLGKYLFTNINLADENVKELARDTNIVKLIAPIANTYSKSTEAQLCDYGVIDNTSYTSSILEEYVKSNPTVLPLNIDVSPELVLIEDGFESDNLISIEAKIVRNAISNKGLIEKEKIAEIKWGEGSYDKYSDQAIVKTIRRLNKKMKVYKFRTISKVGYKLIKL